MAVETEDRPRTTQEILTALERLDPVDLDRVARHLKRLQTAKPETEAQRRETELLRVIRRRPSQLGRHYRSLLRKLEAETLTSEERHELMPLIDLSESFAVQRLEALVELSALRQTSLPTLMQELELHPYRV